MISLSFAGPLHGTLAMLSIVLGAFQFMAPKGGPGHRARGYAYVYGMVVADAAALLIYRFTGHFNMLHVGAIANFMWIVLAMIPVLRSPRSPGWLIRHYYFIAWSYVSLASAGLTQLAMHVVPLHTRQEAWMVIAAATVVTTVTGFLLIRRHRPDRPSPVLQQGVLS
jgi:uncharacterized membrane protein